MQPCSQNCYKKTQGEGRLKAQCPVEGSRSNVLPVASAALVIHVRRNAFLTRILQVSDKQMF